MLYVAWCVVLFVRDTDECNTGVYIITIMRNKGEARNLHG